MSKLKNFNDYELLYLYNLHSEEALRFLIEKYECLIEIKIRAFRVRKSNYDDLKQECLLALMDAIKKYDESFNKTFYRYAELFIERKIMNYLRQETKYSDNVFLYDNLDGLSEKKDLEEHICYQRVLEEIKKAKFNDIKGDILREIFFEGMPIKDFSLKHNLKTKEVYNHIYLLRMKLKRDI